MPIAPKRPCLSPGCRALADKGRCPKHQAEHDQKQEQHRGSASARGYGRKWQKESKAFLHDHPLCMCGECDEGRKRVSQATVVDHKIPHRLKEAQESGNPVAIARAWKLFWDRSNWQSMTKECHDAKTAKEDGGFGPRG